MGIRHTALGLFAVGCVVRVENAEGKTDAEITSVYASTDRFLMHAKFAGSTSVDLSIEIARMALRNPVLLASGTCNYGQELQEITDLSQLGGIVTKTITPQPRAGNRPQRIVETPTGLIAQLAYDQVWKVCQNK